MTHETLIAAMTTEVRDTDTLIGFIHDDGCELGTNYERTDGTMAHACQCAAREIRWVARESLAIMSEGIANDSPRGQAYTARKRALLAYIEATR